MKARLFVVNKDTIMDTLNNMEVSVIVPEPNGRKLWNKTLIDIVSDLLQIEIGDYIFLWQSGCEKIYGVYRAISNPFYEKTDNSNDIFKIKIDTAYEFERPILEYDVINNPYMKNKLWNIIGKKVAGKSRGTSPITIEEMQFLIQSLIDANKSKYRFIKDYSALKVENEISIDFVNECNTDIPNKLSDYIYRPIKVKLGKEVRYEKALEGILNYLFRNKCIGKLSKLDIDCNNVIWFANYLPYGLERSEIDYMVMESIDGTTVNCIDVIELMSGIIDIDHIRRCMQYSRWVASSISNDKNIIRPILICSEKTREARRGFKDKKIKKAIKNIPKEYGFSKIELYTYEITDNIDFSIYEESRDE